MSATSPPIPIRRPAAWQRLSRLPPLRYSLPFLLLVFELGLIVSQYFYFTKLDVERATRAVENQCKQTGQRMSLSLGRMLNERRVEATRSDLKRFLNLPGVLHVEIVSEDRHVILAERESWTNKPMSEVLPGHIIEALDTALLLNHRHIQTREEEGSVVGVFPLIARQPSYLILELDLTAPLSEARSAANSRAITSGLVLLIACIALWLVLDRVVTKRAQHVLAEASAMTTGEPNGSPLEGNDEFAQIDRTLRETHKVIVRQADELRHREERREALAREISNASEREQRRIGQDLHDDICQRLAAVKLSMQDLEESLAEHAPALMDEADAIVDRLTETIRITRGLARGLSPVDIEAGGLGIALAGLARSSREMFGIECKVDMPDELPPMSAHAATQFYRIAQECITNAAKHGQAALVRVSIEERDDSLVMRVSNNGRPFDPRSEDGQGMGLPIMRYRAESMDAKLEFEVQPADATVAVRCLLPLSTHAHIQASSP